MMTRVATLLKPDLLKHAAILFTVSAILIIECVCVYSMCFQQIHCFCYCCFVSKVCHFHRNHPRLDIIISSSHSSVDNPIPSLPVLAIVFGCLLPNLFKTRLCKEEDEGGQKENVGGKL